VNSYSLNRRNKRLVSKKRSFKLDPIVVLASVVFLGVLLSSMAAFGF